MERQVVSSQVEQKGIKRPLQLLTPALCTALINMIRFCRHRSHKRDCKNQMILKKWSICFEELIISDELTELSRFRKQRLESRLPSMKNERTEELQIRRVPNSTLPLAQRSVSSADCSSVSDPESSPCSFFFSKSNSLAKPIFPSSRKKQLAPNALS